MIIIGLFLFVGMVFAASLALDMARYEQERSRVQGIADRAVLAAANIRRDGDGASDATAFVRGYFLSEGYTAEQIDEWDIRVEGDGLTDRTVTVTPRGRLPTMLMTLIGVDDLPLAAPARATVAARSNRLEVVMVLDISGSMGARTSNGLTRLQNLKTAATTMVNDLMQDREPGDIAISLVPYESWVLPPAGLLDRLGLPGTGLCADFNDWNALVSSLGNTVNGTVVGQLPLLRNTVQGVSNTLMTRVNCGSAVGFRSTRLLMTDAEAINNHIEALATMGTTSIDLGVRYGALLMDAGLRPYVEDEVNAGRLPEYMRGRPFGYDDDESMRIMVLMTDGQNCCGHRGNTLQLDRNTRAVCNGLEAARVTVFAVAFEAPQSGVNLMRDCASSDGHFFNTNGEGLSEAFQAIGRQINAQSLRLVSARDPA